MNAKTNDFVAFTQQLVFWNKHKICSGRELYDQSHHYSTPKTINSQAKIFYIEWQDTETQTKKKKLTKGKCK